MTDPDDLVLVADLKKAAANIPAEHIQVFYEFLAHNAEKFGLLPDHPDSADCLKALFTTFTPVLYAADPFRSEELFDDAVNAVADWNENSWDGQREYAEKVLDSSLRQLAPPMGPKLRGSLKAAS